mgnify:CR=1 FL=1
MELLTFKQVVDSVRTPEEIKGILSEVLLSSLLKIYSFRTDPHFNLRLGQSIPLESNLSEAI